MLGDSPVAEEARDKQHRYKLIMRREIFDPLLSFCLSTIQLYISLVLTDPHYRDDNLEQQKRKSQVRNSEVIIIKTVAM